MSLTAATGFAAYNIAATTKKLDLSEELAEIIRTDNTALISRVGVGGLVASQLTHKWVEDKLNPNTAQLDGTITTNTTTVVVHTGEYTRFKLGTLFKFNEAAKSEVCRVSVEPASASLTVERGHGDTSGEAHADDATIMIIGHTKQEDWKPTQEDWSQERTGLYNYLQTMGYGVNISRTRQAVSHAGVPSE